MWHFYCPNIIYGEDAIDFIEKIKGERCFIVTDKTIEDLGYLKILTDKLDKFGKNYSVFADVVPDPHEEDVMKGKEECIKYAPDCVLAAKSSRSSVFADVIPDPHEKDVIKGKDKCIEYNPDLIIALGGGSVIDSAKGIWAIYEYPEYTLDDINPFNDQFRNRFRSNLGSNNF